jgi:CBS domain-containing protein
MEAAMLAKDVMTKSVVTVDPGATVLQAVRLMLQKRISGLPVVDASGNLVGIVTEGDFLRRVETKTERRRPRWLEFILGPGRLADEYVHSHGSKVAEVMTPEPLTIAEDTPLDEVVQTMETRGVKRLPVVRGKRVVGIVSRANLLHALASLAPTAPAPSAGDAAIRDKLMAELDRQKWAPIAALNVVVRDGTVELWGTITDERERQALIVAAENIPGVKAVRDHLAWVEPNSGMVFYAPGDEPDRAKAS